MGDIEGCSGWWILLKFKVSIIVFLVVIWLVYVVRGVSVWIFFSVMLYIVEFLMLRLIFVFNDVFIIVYWMMIVNGDGRDLFVMFVFVVLLNSLVVKFIFCVKMEYFWFGYMRIWFWVVVFVFMVSLLWVSSGFIWFWKLGRGVSLKFFILNVCGRLYRYVFWIRVMFLVVLIGVKDRFNWESFFESFCIFWVLFLFEFGGVFWVLCIVRLIDGWFLMDSGFWVWRIGFMMFYR